MFISNLVLFGFYFFVFILMYLFSNTENLGS